MRKAKQGLAVVISLSLLWTSGNFVQAAEMAPEMFAGVSKLPQFQLIPPGQYGRIADYYNAASPAASLRPLPSGEGGRRPGEAKQPLVILIQDLHAHYGVQKNISSILEFLSHQWAEPSPRIRLVASSLPFAVAVAESAEGPIDSSVLALFPDQKIKSQAADYLMHEGELTGAEHFAVMRGIPNLLVGVENDQYYSLNRDLFRKTLTDRQELVGLLKGLEADMAPLQDRIYGPALADFQKKVEAYNRGEMSTHDFIGMLMDHARTINVKKDFPTLASFAANSHFGTMDQIRAATAEFLTQTQGLLSAEEKNDLRLLAKHGSTTPYYLYIRDLVLSRKKLFLAVPLRNSHNIWNTFTPPRHCWAHGSGDARGA